MSLSYVDYTATGATNYSVPFGYISQVDVTVEVDDVLQVEGAGNDYTWFNATTIQFTAGSTPSPGQIITIRRTTQNTSRLVDFQDAGNLTEYDLDLSANQNFYLAQEAIDNFNDLSLKLTGVLTWDAQNHRIVNVADPVDDQDAVTKLWATTSMTSSLGAALAAQAAAEAAQSYAEEWANKAEDSLVSAAAGGDEVDDYSALHWAAKAAASAAAVVLPDPIVALKFLRGNAGGTAWEQYDIFGLQQTIQVTDGGQSMWTFKSNSAGLDAAAQGFQVRKSDDTVMGAFVIVPDVDAACIYVGSSYAVGDIKFKATSSSSTLDLGATNTITYNSHQLAMLDQANTWTDVQTMNANLIMQGSYIKKPGTASLLYLCGGGAGVTTSGAMCILYGNTHATLPGQLLLQPGTSGQVYMDNGAGTTVLQTASHGLDLANSRITSFTAPASGEGLELSYTGGVAYVTGYDRTGATYKQLNLVGSVVNCAVSGTIRWSVNANSVQHTGAASAYLVLDTSAANIPAGIYLRENGNNKGVLQHDYSSHLVYLRKYLDSTPSSVACQVVLYDSGIVALNNTISGTSLTVESAGYVWNSQNQVSYHGHISTAGAWVRTPVSGWTVSKIGTGQYRVTHNIGSSSSYTVVATPQTASAYYAHVSQANNTFDIFIRDAAGAVQDSLTSFIIQLGT